MKSLISFLTVSALLLVVVTVTAQSVLQVTITGLQGRAGTVRVALFKTAAGFPDQPDRAAITRSYPLTDSIMTATLDSVAAGTYAVAVLHDANNDGKMNYSRLGPPLEGYGVSNNMVSRWGPPQFAKALISLTNTLQPLTIQMHY